MEVERKMRLFIVLGFVCLAAFGDQIVMKNGDRVTGTIVKKDAKTLTIKTAHFGVVTLPWDQVESAKADTPINIVMPEKTVQGTLATADGKVAVTANGTTQTIPPADIVALRDAAEQKTYERLSKPRLKDLWAGTATVGFAGTKGNAETSTFTAGLGAARVTRNDKMSIYFNSIRASASINNVSAQTAQAVRGGLSYNRNMNPRSFVSVFNDWEYDKFQRLDLRSVFGGGLGYHAWKDEHGRLDLTAGVAYSRENFDPVRPALPFTRNSADGYWGDDFSFKLNSRTSLVQAFRMFNNFQDSSRYRMNFDIGATTQFKKWLTWNIALSDRFLNSPVAGNKKNDFIYTTGFGIAFAR